MNVEITGRHLEITDPIRDYIQKRVSKFSKLAGGMCDFHFVLTVEKHRQIAEIIMNSRLGTLTATDESKDLYGSISTALEKLEKQVNKIRDRRKGKSRGNDKEQIAAIFMESVVTDLGQPADLLDNPEVLETQMNSRPMAIDEAIVELTDKNASFIVFFNSKTEEPNVLYRRNDGHFGLIHP